MTDKAKLAMEKIKKLLAFTKENNASEGEIEAAALMVRKILEEHNLTLQDVQVKDIEDGISKEESFPEMSHDHDIYLKDLATRLARAFECRNILSKVPVISGTGRRILKRKYIFVGYETDVLSCVYFFDFLRVALLRLANEEIGKRPDLKASRYIFTNSFILGAAVEIEKRLTKPVIVGTGLMVIKKDAIAKRMPDFYPHLRSSRSRGNSITQDGHVAGRQAGQTIGLNRGISASRPSGLYLR